ncbi:MAG: HEAT repeat domain-containing protein [Planctomycetes bacterium]|nr:HEAT repeat domain-containing protein [Planctomycetota bacterium]
MSDLAALIADLKSTDLSKRIQAAEELSSRGEEVSQAVVALAQACGDDVEEVREAATAALEESGPPGLDDLPALIELFCTPQSDVAYWAITLVGRLGAEAADAVEPLAEVVRQHSVPAVRERAAWALGCIGPVAAPSLDVLQLAATSDNPRLARLARAAIEQIMV